MVTREPMVDVSAYVSVERLSRLTVDLVRCDTSNPPGDESAVLPVLGAELESLGCEVEVFRSAAGRPSLLGRYLPPGRELPVLLINGHIDVVPAHAPDWSVPPFEPVVRNGRIVGRGTADMKGGIAAALEGLRACLESGETPAAEVHFHLVADEETGGAEGTQALMNAGLIRADACIVPEPTRLRVAVAERGSFQARIVVRGVAGHGGDPALGHSAIADAALMVSALHGASFHDSPHSLLGKPSCNVSTIVGGIATNVIAPHCEFTIDRRTLPGESVEMIVASIREKVTRACPDADFQVIPVRFVEASELDEFHPFARYVTQVSGSPEGTEVCGLSLGTDARFLRNQLNIPTVIYGPGAMEQAHAADEWVEIEELATAAKAFARIYRDFSAVHTSKW